MESYNFKAIEKKWQDKWEETGAFHAETNSKKPACVMPFSFLSSLSL